MKKLTLENVKSLAHRLKKKKKRKRKKEMNALDKGKQFNI